MKWESPVMMGKSVKRVWFLLCLLTAVSASAQEAPTFTLDDAITIQWTNATMNVDSSPASLALSRVVWGTCPGEFTIAGQRDVTYPGNVLIIPASDIGIGTWCFAVYHVATYGVPSEFSNLVSGDIILTPVPLPPTNVIITSTKPITGLIQKKNKLEFRTSGLVAIQMESIRNND